MEDTGEIMARLALIRSLKTCVGFIRRHFEAAEDELDQRYAELMAELEPVHIDDERQESLSWILSTHNIHSC